MVKARIPLQIVEGRLILNAVIVCPKVRVPPTFMDFVVDTGSQDSFLSYKDVLRLQIPIKDRISAEEVDFGGSRFKRVILPQFKLHLLKEDKENKEHITIDVELSALKTTKTSIPKMQIAQQLPSILGMDFLKKQKVSLHVILTENLAYLEYEG